MDKKIMVVDDEPDTLELVDAVLSMHKFEVTIFDAAEEALNKLEKGYTPDLVLLDMRMPRISGPDFCKLVKKIERLKDLKIVFFTASSNEDNETLKENDVKGYIFKPFDNDGLVKEINTYLEM